MSTRFIQTDQGLINLQFVVSVCRRKVTPRKNRPNEFRSEVTYLEGENVLTALSDVGTFDLDSLTAPVISATPGYFVVNVYDESPDGVELLPVVGWRLEKEFAEPVSIDDISGCYGVLDPTGKVTVPFTCTYPSLESYRQERVQQMQRLRAGVPPPPPPPAPGSSVPTLPPSVAA